MVLEVGGVRQFGPAVQMTAMPEASMRTAPAKAGADTQAILTGLGVDGEAIVRLRAAGVI
jgi:crotonobetainyl-CoA:carnitine CoA-transferase CaiB-like acyl-CoA transferase